MNDDDLKLWRRFTKDVKPINHDRFVSTDTNQNYEDNQTPFERMEEQLFYNMKNYNQQNPDQLDLHGKSLNQAYGMVQRFIERSWERGLRHITIITGHGDGETSISREFPDWMKTGMARMYVSDIIPERVGNFPGAYTIRLKPNPRCQ